MLATSVLIVCLLPACAAQSLYERACEYMELETRVEVLNVRFQVSSAGEALHPGVGTAERCQHQRQADMRST
jgi:hypothetical protein